MPILDRLRHFIASEAEHLTYVRIPPKRVRPKVGGEPFDVGTSYFQVRLVEMFLRNDREFWMGRYPLVHSTVRALYAGQRREIPYVAGPDQLGGGGMLTKQRLSRVINLNHRIAGPIPYEGDEVELAVGLFAVRDVDWGDAALKLVSGVANALTTLPLQLALPVVEQMKTGLEGLLGLDDVSFKLGLRDAFQSPQITGGNTLSDGYVAALKVGHSAGLEKRLRVVNGRLYEGRSWPSAERVKGYDYFLLRVERVQNREDYGQFSFHRAWERLIERLFGLSDEEIQDAFTGVKQAIVMSPDLTRAQKVQLIKLYEGHLDDFRALKPARKRKLAAPPVDIEKAPLPPEEAVTEPLPPLA